MGLYELDTWAREDVCSDTAEGEVVLILDQRATCPF
jgi:hypothetical protein